MAVFSRLLPAIGTAYTIQSLAALIFVPRQQDMFYDLAGALGFLSSTLVSLYYPALKVDRLWNGVPGALPALSTFAPRQLIINAALAIWATRLGTFLFHRAVKHGGDSRFEKIKKTPRKFTYYWFAQATWNILVGLPVHLVNILPAVHHKPLGPRDYIGIAIFASSLALEVIADYQKSTWRAKKMRGEHNEKFIKSGLWAVSRHPNYVGEIGVWAGMWALSTSSLRHPFFPGYTPAIAAISPLFTWFIVTQRSGIPLLEKAGKERFGDDPEYNAYTQTVPVLWPWGATKVDL